jgi:hypothetical protein
MNECSALSSCACVGVGYIAQYKFDLKFVYAEFGQLGHAPIRVWVGARR